MRYLELPQRAYRGDVLVGRDRLFEQRRGAGVITRREADLRQSAEDHRHDAIRAERAGQLERLLQALARLLHPPELDQHLADRDETFQRAHAVREPLSARQRAKMDLQRLLVRAVLAVGLA